MRLETTRLLTWATKIQQKQQKDLKTPTMMKNDPHSTHVWSGVWLYTHLQLDLWPFHPTPAWFRDNNVNRKARSNSELQVLLQQLFQCWMFVYFMMFRKKKDAFNPYGINLNGCGCWSSKSTNSTPVCRDINTSAGKNNMHLHPLIMQL